MAMAQPAQGGDKRRLQPWLPKRPAKRPCVVIGRSARGAPVVPVGASAACSDPVRLPNWGREHGTTRLAWIR